MFDDVVIHVDRDSVGNECECSIMTLSIPINAYPFLDRFNNFLMSLAG